MEAVASTSSATSNVVPVFSRELTLEAHFTFNSPSVALTPAAEVRTQSPGLRVPAEDSTKESKWHWAEGGAHCSVECGRTGLSMKYETAPPSFERSSYATLPRQQNSLERSESGGLGHQSAEAPRHHVARPYERRCKSTAQIFLKQVDEPTKPKSRASEFHGSTNHEVLRKKPTEPPQSASCHSCASCGACKSPSSHQRSLCACLHCLTLQTLVRSLSQECPNACSAYHSLPPPAVPYSRDFRSSSIAQQSFNSHRAYQQQPPFGSLCQEDESDLLSSRHRRAESPSAPTFRSPSPKERERAKEPSGKRGRKERGTRERTHSRGKSRPKTIHIDVYCSTSDSSSSEGGFTSDEGSRGFEESPPSERRRARATLALGSKKGSGKSDFILRPKEQEARKDGGNGAVRTGSFIYQYKKHSDSPTVSTFMTDHPLSLCSSPPTLERPASSPPTVSIERGSARNRYDSAIPLTAKPTTLPVSPLYTSGYPSRKYPGTPPGTDRTPFEHRRTNSFGSGPTASFQPQSPDLFDPLSRSHSNISSLFEEFVNMSVNKDQEAEEAPAEGGSKLWRSPKLERRKYLVDSQDEWHETRAAKMDRIGQYSSREITQPLGVGSSPARTELIRTPTEVVDLAKMSVFKDFSEEELKVISKSLTKRESERSSLSSEKTVASRPLSRHSSFSSPRTGSFRNQQDNGGGCYPLRPTPTDLDSCNDEDIQFAETTSSETVKRKEKVQPEEESSHSFKKSYEKTKLVKFLDQTSDPSRTNASTSSSDQPISKYVRPINVGLFRRINRFPFNTHPTSYVRGGGSTSGSYSHQLRLNDPRLVRPHIFGEALVRANRRQGIHFGPPRNPQCSCVNCTTIQCDRSWLGSRIKSQSLSNLSPPDDSASSDHSQVSPPSAGFTSTEETLRDAAAMFL